MTGIPGISQASQVNRERALQYPERLPRRAQKIRRDPREAREEFSITSDATPERTGRAVPREGPSVGGRGERRRRRLRRRGRVVPRAPFTRFPAPRNANLARASLSLSFFHSRRRPSFRESGEGRRSRTTNQREITNVGRVKKRKALESREISQQKTVRDGGKNTPVLATQPGRRVPLSKRHCVTDVSPTPTCVIVAIFRTLGTLTVTIRG